MLGVGGWVGGWVGGRRGLPNASFLSHLAPGQVPPWVFPNHPPLCWVHDGEVLIGEDHVFSL